MATTIDTFGDAGAGETVLSGFFSPPAAAGDVLLVVAVGSATGDGLTEPTPDDNTGAGTWTKLADLNAGAGADEFRATWWAKTCIGGEDTPTLTWSGSSDVAMQGVVAKTPTFPTPYVIGAAGVLVWDAGLSQMRYTAGSPSTNGQTYVALAANGPVDVSDGQIVAPPGNSGGTSQTVSGVVGALANWNTLEGSHTTADVLRYRITPRMDDGAVVAVFGFGTGPDHLAGTGELALGGSGSLLVGGNVQLEGAGGMALGGSGRILAPAPRPVPGPPDLTDTLDCGVYDAMVFTRGLGEIVGRLPFGQIDWGRVLDGVSTAGLTVDGVANRSQLQKCCALLGEVEPFEHELGIYRNGYRVWSGPITAMSFPPNQIQVSAFDLSGWLQLRTLHEDYNAVQIDLIDIWINYVQDAMAVENSAGLHPTALALSGILADRLTQITEHNIALDAIGELERTGIDWTTIDRVMQAGPVLTQPPPIADAGEFPLLIDSSFRVAPTILLDGMQGANCWFVQGGAAGTAGAPIFGEYGPEFEATPDHVAQAAAPDYAAIEGQYGRIEKVVSESRVLDQPSIDDNARSRYDLTKRPVAVISEGLLLPSAPIAMRKLVPGSLVQIHLADACKPIGDFYRIKSVKVSAHGDGSEDVNVEFQPLGTGTVLA